MTVKMLPASASAPVAHSGFNAMVSSSVQHSGRVSREETVKVGGFILRLVLMLFGASMVVSGFGLWLVPETLVDPGMMLMKLGVSLFLLLTGLCLLVIGRDARPGFTG